MAKRTKIVGRDKVLKKLKEMPKEIRQEMAASILKGAEEMTSSMKAAAPVEDGDLQMSITYSQGQMPPPNSGVMGAFKFRNKGKKRGSTPGDKDLTVYVTAGSETAFYARFVEFGTAPHWQPNRFGGFRHPGAQAKPFFFPVFRMLRKRVKRRIARATNAAARKVAGKK